MNGNPKILAASALLMLAIGSASAQTYRVSNYAYGAYEAYSTISFPPFGSYSRTDTLGWLGYSEAAFSTAGLPLSHSASGTWTDTAGLGMGDVNFSVFTSTDFRHNHAKVSLDGFVSVNASSTTPYCPTDPSGVCLAPPVDVETQLSNNAWLYGSSRWEELYYIGGGSGSGVLTPTYHIDGTLGPGTGVSTGSASFSWLQRDFAGHVVLGISASYDLASDSWSKSVFNTSTQQWQYSNGSGSLVLNENLSAAISFDYNQAFYVDSQLWTQVSQNGLVDFENTVTLSQLTLPAGARLYVSSGTDYSGTAHFLGSGGVLCNDQSCATGGGGGGTPPVPEPASWALWLGGVALLAAWRQRSRER